MTGLKKGAVVLVSHQKEWEEKAEDTINLLKQILGDTASDIHHIHIVKRDGADWNNYINFRDYLNANPEKAMMYDELKQDLAKRFPDDRKNYTAGKAEMIDRLLAEADVWKVKTYGQCRR